SASRLGYGPSLCAVEHREQPRHVLVHARVGTGDNVEIAVTVKVHKLWSGRGASPHTRYFGYVALRLKPDAFGEFSFAEVLVDLDLALVELSDIKLFLPLHVDPPRPPVPPRPDPTRHSA